MNVLGFTGLSISSNSKSIILGFTGVSIVEQVNCVVHIVNSSNQLQNDVNIEVFLGNNLIDSYVSANGVNSYYLENGSYKIRATKEDESVESYFTISGESLFLRLLLVQQTYEFLTTKPLKRELFRNQQEWLYMMATADMGDSDLNFNIVYTDQSAHQLSVNIGVIAAGQIFCKNIGFDTMGYESYNSEKIISYIEVNIDHPNELLTLIPKDSNSDNERHFYYFNSRAGLDSFICTGEQQVNVETDEQEFFMDMSEDASIDQAEYLSNQNRLRNPFVLHSGYKPRKEIESTRDMLLVNKMYELVEKGGLRGFAPVKIDQKSVTFPSSNDNMSSISFKARPAWDEKALDRI